MIGPEDIHESPKANYTPVMILGIAALLLVIVAFISFKDYVNSEADQRIKKMEEMVKEQARNQNSINQQQQTPAVSTPQRDPEIEELRRQLEEERLKFESLAEKTKQNEARVKQTELLAKENSLKLEKFLGSPPPSFQGSSSGNSPIGPSPIGIRDDLTNPAWESVKAPPSGYAPPEGYAPAKQMTELEKQIKDAPAIGKVVSYQEEWNLVTIDAGEVNGIKEGQRYSLRRGFENLGVVKILEVNPEVSNATIVTASRNLEGANLKPKVGDEIIAFDPSL